jgi:hypothetical protein
MKDNLKATDITWRDITSLDELATIKDDWCALNTLCDKGNLFTSPSWNNAWIETYWQNHWQLQVITGWHEKNLIAIFPLYFQLQKHGFTTKSIFALGTGEPESSEVFSEYFDLLLHPHYEDIVLPALAKKITLLAGDQLYFRAILYNSHLITLLQQAINYSFQPSHTRYVVERSTWSLENVSKNNRARYNRSRNQLAKINANFCWVGPEDYEVCLKLLKKYHQIRWQKKGQKGAFLHPDFSEFHHTIRNNHQHENVKMSAIVIDGHPVAINYYLLDSQTLYFYQCGWDETNYANFSLGMSLHLWSIVHCEQQFYDFMMGGDNDSYKAKFGGEQVPMANIKIDLNKGKVFVNKVLKKFGFN